jgi:hypothetical protein
MITDAGFENCGDDAGGHHIASAQEQAFCHEIIREPGKGKFWSA